MGPRHPRAGKRVPAHRNGEAGRGPHLRTDGGPSPFNGPCRPIGHHPQQPVPHVHQGDAKHRHDERGVRGGDERAVLRDEGDGGVRGGDGEEEYGRRRGFQILRRVLRLGDGAVEGGD
ncbi:unnamed protein product [Linum tenue]|uniref:Uncharacterized protein n=1 Tax=Linum tenue TaxID=586396 RepID=A0AAV0N5T7_9ROSI|nr:unnamed protein product [Linum tenue]